jgi:hypothetical protein
MADPQQQSAVKSFTTALSTKEKKRRDKEREKERFAAPVPVEIDKHTLVFNGPDSTQLMLLSAAAQNSSDEQAISTALTILFNLLDESTDEAKSEKRWLRSRLYNQNDPLDIFVILDVITYVVQQWSGGFPTGAASD